MEHLWSVFGDLNATRQSGMAPNPISYLEIEAYSRTMLVDLSVWEKRLLRRLDDVVRGVMAKDGPSVQPQGPVDIPADNGPALGAFLRGLAAKKAAQKKA